MINDFLKKASEAYYSGNPIITDEQFDKLVDLYGFNEVGAKPAGKTVKHLYRMYSLQKVYEGEDDFPFNGYETVKSVKLDGAAISLLYLDGNLVQVATRGDGIEGQDITDKFLDGKLVPLFTDWIGLTQVTGEIVAPKTIENARNYAAGALNLKDLEEFKKRALTFIAYGVQASDIKFGLYEDDMDELEDVGFLVAKNFSLTQDIFPIDGFVVRINNNKEFEELGYTSKHPRGAYAIKTRGEAVETTLIRVDWQVGKSGKVTPVAILEPVMVGDAEVSRATLNNQSYIEALELYIGCTVGIIRSGEIIPQVVYRV